MIRIELDSREVTRALNRLLNCVDDMRPAFDDIGAALVTRIHDDFQDSQDPWGNSWDGLAKPRRNSHAKTTYGFNSYRACTQSFRNPYWYASIHYPPIWGCQERI